MARATGSGRAKERRTDAAIMILICGCKSGKNKPAARRKEHVCVVCVEGEGEGGQVSMDAAVCGVQSIMAHLSRRLWEQLLQTARGERVPEGVRA